MSLLSCFKRLPSWWRQAFCALALVPVFALIHYTAYWLRFEGTLEQRELGTMGTTIGWAIIVKLLVFGWYRLLQGWNSYVTFHDLLTLARAATAACLLLALGDYLLMATLQIPRSVFVLDWGVTIVVVGALRSVARILVEWENRVFADEQSSVLIVGADDSGEALLRYIRRNPQLRYRVVGFISAEPSGLHTRIGGVPVVGRLEQTARLAKKYKAAEILIAAGNLSGRQVRRLVEVGRRCGVLVKVLPSYEQLLHDQVSLQPRTVSIEDLLRRDPVQLDLQELQRWIKDRVLLVTGSAGSIGSEICRQLLQFTPRKLVLVDRAETAQFFLERELRRIAPGCGLEVLLADINDRRRMECILKNTRPDIVFHAAAYKHVPLMEENPGEAVRNITLATRHLADLAGEHDVETFVLISTDKAVNPTSVMGTCKRAAELYVQALAQDSDCRFVTVRFGNVLGSAGSVIPVFQEQISKGGPLTVTHPEMRRFFMTIPEASQLVIQAGAMGRGGEVFVLDMGEPVRIVDLAADMIRLSGLRLGRDIEIKLVGTRPGEKLYEELHVEGEMHVPTTHPKIRVAQATTCSLAKLDHALGQLETAAYGPREPVLELLRSVVPQYGAQSAGCSSNGWQPVRQRAA